MPNFPIPPAEVRQLNSTCFYKVSSFPFSLLLSPHFIFNPSPSSKITIVGQRPAHKEGLLSHRGESVYICPLALGSEYLTKVPGWKRTEWLPCSTNDRFYFMMRIFIFFGFSQPAHCHCVCYTKSKSILIVLATQISTFYHTFLTTLNMLLNFWEIYILHLLVLLHIDGGLDDKQPFSDFSKGNILELQIFSSSPYVFCNSYMRMMLCFMSLNFIQLHPQFRLRFILGAFNITSLDLVKVSP